jgi:hypothetical protein
MESKISQFVALPVLLAVLVAPLGAQELLQNGGFEQDLSVGWTIEVENYSGDWTISRDSSHAPDPDNEVMVRKYLYGYASLRQTVPVENLHVLLSGELRFFNLCQPNTEGKFAASALRIEYKDGSNSTLGETRIYNGTENCDWTSSSTLHLIEEEGSEWIAVHLGIRDELQNLPGVDTSQIAGIALSLYSYSTNPC